MKITKNDILKIKPNTSLTFQMNSYKECESAREVAYRTALRHPRENVERYSVSIDTKSFKMTIEAIGRKE